MGKVFLLLAALPLLDLYVLFKLGKVFGGATAVLYVLLAGVTGAWLMRATGVKVVGAWRRAIAQGRPADQGAANGVLQFVACALLIMPGVISDVLGLSLFVPALRQAIARRINRSIREAIERGSLQVAQAQAQAQAKAPPPYARTQPPVIDVEAEVVESTEATPEPPKRLER